MRKIGIIAFILAIYTASFAQDKSEKIVLGKGEELIDVIDLQENGVLIKTGKTAENWQLRYYSPNLSLKWNVPIEKVQSNIGLSNPICVSTSGNTVFHVELTGNKVISQNTDSYSTGANITIISKDGSKKNCKISFPGKQGLSDSYFVDVLSFFGNDNQLFILFSDDNTFKKANKRVLKLMSINLSDLKSKTYDIMTVVQTQYAEYSFCFLKLDNDLINIYESFIDIEKKINTSKIHKISFIGEIKESISIDYAKSGMSFYQVENYNYTKGLSPNLFEFSYNRNTNSYIKVYNSSYSNYIYPLNNNEFLMYGISKPLNLKDKANSIGGGVAKFDYNGNFIASFNSNDYKECSNVNKISSSNLSSFFYLNNTSLRPYINNSLVLRNWMEKKGFYYYIDSNLKLIEANVKEFKTGAISSDALPEEALIVMPTKTKLKYQAYLTKKQATDDKKVTYNYLFLPKSSILVRNSPKESLVELLYFNEGM